MAVSIACGEQLASDGPLLFTLDTFEWVLSQVFQTLEHAVACCITGLVSFAPKRMRAFVRIKKQKVNNLVDDEMQMAATPETGQDQISDLASGRVSNQEISIGFQQRFGM